VADRYFDECEAAAYRHRCRPSPRPLDTRTVRRPVCPHRKDTSR
jgi:hypothetical protein